MSTFSKMERHVYRAEFASGPLEALVGIILVPTLVRNDPVARVD